MSRQLIVPPDVQVPFVSLALDGPGRLEEMEQSIGRVLHRAWFILGQELEEFEAEFAAYCGARYCVGVNSGTDALHLALKACDIGPGDEVITVSHTFVATVLGIVWTGATPVLVDIDPVTYTIDANQVADAVTPRTRAIIPVHLYGQCAEMDAILAVAKQHGLRVIEDAAQAHGAQYGGRKAGNLGDVACFSFYPTKNLGAYGDGGALTTNDGQIADRLRRLRNYGQTRKYVHETIGYNTRLDELQAAVLRAKLKHLDQDNTRRRGIASRYLREIGDGVVKPATAPGREHVYHLFVIECEKRDRLQAHLSDCGIQTQVHYPIPVHKQPALRERTICHNLSVTERVAARILSLPIYPTLTDENVTRVCRGVNTFQELNP